MIINLIAGTTTNTGLKLYAQLHQGIHKRGSRSPMTNSPQ